MEGKMETQKVTDDELAIWKTTRLDYSDLQNDEQVVEALEDIKKTYERFFDLCNDAASEQFLLIQDLAHKKVGLNPVDPEAWSKEFLQESRDILENLFSDTVDCWLSDARSNVLEIKSKVLEPEDYYPPARI